MCLSCRSQECDTEIVVVYIGHPVSRKCSAFVVVIMLTCSTCGRCRDDELKGSHEICCCFDCVVGIKRFCCRQALGTSTRDQLGSAEVPRIGRSCQISGRAHNFPDTDGHSHIHEREALKQYHPDPEWLHCLDLHDLLE